MQNKKALNGVLFLFYDCVSLTATTVNGGNTEMRNRHFHVAKQPISQRKTGSLSV